MELDAAKKCGQDCDEDLVAPGARALLGDVASETHWGPALVAELPQADGPQDQPLEQAPEELPQEDGLQKARDEPEWPLGCQCKVSGWPQGLWQG